MEFALKIFSRLEHASGEMERQTGHCKYRCVKSAPQGGAGIGWDGTYVAAERQSARNITRIGHGQS